MMIMTGRMAVLHTVMSQKKLCDDDRLELAAEVALPLECTSGEHLNIGREV